MASEIVAEHNTEDARPSKRHKPHYSYYFFELDGGMEDAFVSGSVTASDFRHDFKDLIVGERKWVKKSEYLKFKYAWENNKIHLRTPPRRNNVAFPTYGGTVDLTKVPDVTPSPPKSTLDSVDPNKSASEPTGRPTNRSLLEEFLQHSKTSCDSVYEGLIKGENYVWDKPPKVSRSSPLCIALLQQPIQQ